MKILFLCGIYPQSFKDEIFNNSKKGYQFAAQTFQEAVVEGLLQNDVDFSIATIPFISSFPLGYKKPIINLKASKINNKAVVTKSYFINIPFLKTLSSNTKNEVFKWCKDNSSEKVLHIIVYSLNANLIDIAVKTKLKFKNIKLSVIVLDLPEFMGSNYIYKFLGLQKKDTQFIYDSLKYFEHFILLTEAMNRKLHLGKNNYCVVEGIFNSQQKNQDHIQLLDKDNKNILYTGALVRKYGIETLLKAFSLINDDRYRLIICGEGEAKELIEEYCKIDLRIQYRGKVAHDLILSYQKQADLLINPRTPIGEYTEFSFPSKTMEYFASGTPVLMYKLPGVPPTYFDYCYTLNDNSEVTLSKKIVEILNLPNYEREEMGKRAANFIVEKKNSKSQVNKILRLINSDILN
ncbi:glycosyltransferase [Chryseobacterium indoltheticum]|uniref:glycosyltransferase n=1 Tax=Chryseobacterium indoltheticum TaxID=254 RepID=UPI001911370C|nr:glycosyltransferase [Chryseobacterium indoltheticum]QQQ28048.1 glycosyltransferase [Chryseobacterium indoltheticum]